MRRYLMTFFSLIFVASVLVGCGGSIKSLQEPPTSENSILIVGQIILENNFYNTNQTEVVKDGIQVAIIGQVNKNGKKKIVGYWATTDPNGYFYLADVPPGKYNIKGIKGVVSRGTLVTITNPLKYTGSVYQIQPGEIVIFDGKIFPFTPQNRVIDLQHNLFVIDKTSERTGNVNHMALLSLKQVKLVTGEVVSEAPVPKYFIEKYPNSPWKPYLEKLLESEAKMDVE